jgi:hypothetical protein
LRRGLNPCALLEELLRSSSDEDEDRAKTAITLNQQVNQINLTVRDIANKAAVLAAGMLSRSGELLFGGSDEGKRNAAFALRYVENF